MKTTNWWWNMKPLKNQDICFFVFFFKKSNIKWIDAYINDVKPFKLYTLFYDLEPKTKSKKKKSPRKNKNNWKNLADYWGTLMWQTWLANW